MDPDRLSGWKEIAAHLRRSVRAVQRWEHELGLPVKRVKTAAGHVVFASRADLDAWLAQQQFDPAHAESDEEAPLTEPGTPQPAPAFAETTAGRLRTGAYAAAAIVIISLGAWGLPLRWWMRQGS